jgi:O-antigen ligase
VLLAVAPAMIVPGALDRFVFGKLFVAAAGAALAFLARPAGRLPRLFVVGGAAAGVVLVIAAIVSTSPWASLSGRAPRYEGVFVLATYAAAAVAGARLLGPADTTQRRQWFLRATAVTAALVAVLAVLESFGLRPLSTNVARPGSLLGNASDEGAYAVLAAGVLAAAAVRSRDLLVTVGAAAAAVTVVLSGSRAALVALVVAAVVVAVLSGGRRPRVVVAVAALAAVALAFIVTPTRDRLLEASPLAAHTAHGRVLLWQESLALLGHHPLAGVGPSGFEVSIQHEHDARWQREVGPQDPPDSPHDWLLQAGAAGGVPLLLLALLIAAAVVVHGIRRVRGDPDDVLAVGALAGLIGYGVALLAHFTAPGETPYAAVLAGALVASPLAAGQPGRRRRDVATGVVLAAVAFVFVFAAAADIVLRSAFVAAEHGDVDTADQRFHAAANLRPWDVDVALMAVHAFAQLSLDDPAARTLAGAWITDAPQTRDPQFLVDQATVDEAGHDYPTAVELLTAALAADHDDPSILLRRGVVHAEAHEFAAAESDLLRAASLSPDSPDPWRDLAIVYREQGRAADAARASQEAQRRSS